MDEWGQPGKIKHQVEPQIDTRQIRIFLSVLELGSVTRAANALGITQPAVSQVLRRLRDMTDDPLLVRSGSKLIPTIRAEEMLGPLRTSLKTIDAAFQSDQSFDPARDDLVFRIASADCMEAFFLPRFISEIRKSAPNARIHLRSIVSGYDYAMALEKGELDLVIANWPGPPGNLRTVRLMTDEMVCIVGPDHDLKETERVTLDDYMGLEHVAPSPFSPRVQGPIDGKLAELGLFRNIRVIVPEFNIVPYVLMSTDLVFTSSVSFARHYELFLPIRSIPAPPEFGTMQFYLLWHERAQASPMNRWLRAEMIRIARDLE
ncbi:HTH-type transcriptional regulator SyrM 1 (plasmid) [Pseudosulfitobacter pseudonitzschiae]|uniref:HTH-type transcriptional regulator SyrM 1 n=1 Tax=Pseudosulfitobacter pseudonitzschiae TaxID=1402135 RepID=A0A221K8C2_9RHOB|nr:LysR family transcriptional regulator [Sulfitobacter sp. DFL-23]ASM75236.1 HTH-type transcriptional regulator SyrM 1 [Pseudosulfitobacter pseudonitzschiae]